MINRQRLTEKQVFQMKEISVTWQRRGFSHVHVSLSTIKEKDLKVPCGSSVSTYWHLEEITFL